MSRQPVSPPGAALKVPFLPDKTIERNAGALLAGYAQAENITVGIPVPLDELLVHLGLRLDFDDLRAKFDLPDVLGALWIEERHIYIDQDLDPDERASALGRFRFTLAHEIGHWCLHRTHYELQHRHDDLFARSTGPSIICRSSQRKERIELQADAYAGCLLMPRAEVVRQWHRLIGPEPLQLSHLQADRQTRPAQAVAWSGRASIGPGTEDDAMIELAIRPLAEAFEVSPQAMRIRLERLGLVVREPSRVASLFAAQ